MALTGNSPSRCQPCKMAKQPHKRPATAAPLRLTMALNDSSGAQPRADDDTCQAVPQKKLAGMGWCSFSDQGRNMSPGSFEPFGKLKLKEGFDQAFIRPWEANFSSQAHTPA